MAASVKTGSFTGTGAALNVELGFVPTYVRIWNETDGGLIGEWVEGLTDDYYYKSADNAANQFTVETANGVTPYDPTDYSSKKGFTVGTDLSVSAKVYRYMAFRDGGY